MANKKPIVCEPPTKTDAQIVAECNALAREFYMLHGYGVEKGYRFDKAHHPQELGMWLLAAMAYEHCTDTDPEDALSNLEDTE